MDRDAAVIGQIGSDVRVQTLHAEVVGSRSANELGDVDQRSEPARARSFARLCLTRFPPNAVASEISKTEASLFARLRKADFIGSCWHFMSVTRPVLLWILP
jgi:hypothetical protein